MGKGLAKFANGLVDFIDQNLNPIRPIEKLFDKTKESLQSANNTLNTAQDALKQGGEAAANISKATEAATEALNAGKQAANDISKLTNNINDLLSLKGIIYAILVLTGVVLLYTIITKGFTMLYNFCSRSLSRRNKKQDTDIVPLLSENNYYNHHRLSSVYSAKNQGVGTRQFNENDDYDSSQNPQPDAETLLSQRLNFFRSYGIKTDLAQANMYLQAAKLNKTPTQDTAKMRFEEENDYDNHQNTQLDAEQLLLHSLNYYIGRGVETNFFMAYKLYRQAVKLMNTPAQDAAKLCLNEANDHNTHQNSLPDAEKLYLQGKNYLSGNGVKSNHATAAKLFYQAAKLGYAPAQYELGGLYAFSGAERDEKKAYYWYQQAAKQGHEGAKISLMFFNLETVNQKSIINSTSSSSQESKTKSTHYNSAYPLFEKTKNNYPQEGSSHSATPYSLTFRK